MFLSELEEIFKAINMVEFQKIMVSLFWRIDCCTNSFHFQVFSIFLWYILFTSCLHTIVQIFFNYSSNASMFLSLFCPRWCHLLGFPIFSKFWIMLSTFYFIVIITGLIFNFFGMSSVVLYSCELWLHLLLAWVHFIFSYWSFSIHFHINAKAYA